MTKISLALGSETLFTEQPPHKEKRGQKRGKKIQPIVFYRFMLERKPQTAPEHKIFLLLSNLPYWFLYALFV